MGPGSFFCHLPSVHEKKKPFFLLGSGWKGAEGFAALSAISPIHKLTEGRAPVRVSEFTTKAVHYRGRSEKIAAESIIICVVRGARYSPPLWNSWV